ncbi:MAG: CCA tRNA nucleotidyltransferase [Vulcanimicrobiaceae bacterium]
MTEAETARIDGLLSAALPPGALFAVGGRVRDEMRSALDGVMRLAKDLDYVAVGIELEELTERLNRIGKSDVVGASFAVVKCTLPGTDGAPLTVDVALPRRESSTGAGHREFVIEAGPQIPLEDDLARRDFRMNMLARRLPDGILVDPFGGESDIRARRIDILKAQAFEEDPLRMLRAAQFAARFDYTLTRATLASMTEAAPLVAFVSAERVRDELCKLLGAARPSVGLELLRETGVLPYVLPEVAEGVGVEQNEFHAYDVYRHSLETLDAVPPGDSVLRLAALLHDVAKPRTKEGPHFYRHEIVGEELSAELLTRLRFPNETADTVARLVRNHMYAADPSQSDATLRRFIRRVGPENLERQFALRAADIVGSGLPKRSDVNERFQERVREVLAQRPALSVRDLAISGDDVIAALVAGGGLPRGSKGGPEVGGVLRTLLERVVDDPHVNERETLLAMLPGAIDSAAPASSIGSSGNGADWARPSEA